ncbi:MAG: type II secretion system protein [Phycisphaerales bacterium]|jgi:prepilin-type N-terminal cleavage/methylation domain-containing protein|nr:type II secretion system protein [Phycisphaerales bacterium]
MRFRGFTMIEILVTMAIIVLLIGLLVVAAGGAREAAMVATTKSRLKALSQAVTRFESEAGCLPPLLDNDRAGVDGLEPTRKMVGGYPAYLTAMQRRYSYTSPAEYLLGYGDEQHDGYGYDPEDPTAETAAALGIRRPGDDGFWNASWSDALGADDGRAELCERRPERDGHLGEVLGPYLELDDPAMVGAIGWDGDCSQENADASDHWDFGAWDGSIDPATNQPLVLFPGDAGYSACGPKVIVDAWGTPIRYYRLNHPPGNPGGTYPPDYQPSVGWTYSPSMAEYFALRPWEFDEGEGTDWWFVDESDQRWGDYGPLDGGSSRGDPSIPRTLLTGRFAFMSAGPNRRIYDWARVDFPGEAIDGLSDGRGDHGAYDSAASGWYEDGMDLRWLGKPAFDAGVAATEEANRDNIVEVGQ